MDENEKRVVRTPPLPREYPVRDRTTSTTASRSRGRERSSDRARRSRTKRSRSRHSRGRSSRVNSGSARNSRRHRSQARTHRSRSTRTRSRSKYTDRNASRSRNATTSGNQNLELLDSLKALITCIRPENKSECMERFPVMNVLPEFDPANRNQSINTWLSKVNETASIYNWSERQTIHYALPKLAGVSQKWYQGLPSLKFSWAEWQDKLKAAFPSREHYGLLLTEMLEKRAKYGDSLEEYFYEKILLLNRCRITGIDAIDCILLGIDDRAVRTSAEAAQFTEPDKLLVYLRNQKLNKPKFVFKSSSISEHKNSDNKVPKSGNSKVVKCFNCGEEGHPHFKCKLPIKKCESCSRIGHVASECTVKKSTDVKTVS